MSGRVIILIVLIPILFSSCEETSPDNDIPFVIVQETINLNNFQFLDLKTIGGYVLMDGGNRGIILYRESQSKYRAFDRNCSFQPLEDCARIEPDASGIFLIDPCCESKFNFSGDPFEGPAYRPLLEYQTFLDGNFLTISN